MKNILGFQAIAEAQTEEMKKDDTAIIIGLNTSTGGGMMESAGVYQALGPGHTIDAPIAEMGYSEFAVGMALSGVHTVVEIQFADFSAYAFDAIVNQAAKVRYLSDGKRNLPLVIRVCQGKGLRFGAQHSQCVESWYHNVPGLKIVMPTTAYDYKGLMKTAMRGNDPVLFIESKQCLFTKGEVPEEEYTIPFGQARIAREGTDVTVIAIQSMLSTALAVADEVAKDGIDLEVIDPRSIVPLDKKTLCDSAKKTGRVIVFHEAPVRGGIGGELSAVITENCFKELKAPVKRVGSLNTPIPLGRIEDHVLPGADSLKKAIASVLETK
jgi:pyruvate/2-oxoglutarate/acetoin dehydrogenase E1 component